LEGPPRDPLFPSAAPVSIRTRKQADNGFEDAPRCHRVGGSDDNAELSRQVPTRALLSLNARVILSATRLSGLQNRGDALATRGADGDQAAYRLTAILLFGLVQLLGQLGENASASRGKRVTGCQRRAVDIEL
jgi:hypothetical protein